MQTEIKVVFLMLLISYTNSCVINHNNYDGVYVHCDMVEDIRSQHEILDYKLNLILQRLNITTNSYFSIPDISFSITSYNSSLLMVTISLISFYLLRLVL